MATAAPERKRALSKDDLGRIDRYWRAANYLSVGQIYLLDNPLLKEPLTLEHVKPRLLGHWGTTPGLNFIYAHLNRLIRQHDLDMIYICGPGHGGPAMVANTYLEGTYTELYPNITEDTEGMQKLFRQFSFPGGVRRARLRRRRAARRPVAANDVRRRRIHPLRDRKRCSPRRVVDELLGRRVAADGLGYRPRLRGRIAGKAFGTAA